MGLCWFLVSIVICIALLLICNQLVISNADGRLFDEVETVPEGYSFGLLLGTTPQTRIGHRRNMFFESRIQAAASLYHAGKIQKVLISVTIALTVSMRSSA